MTITMAVATSIQAVSPLLIPCTDPPPLRELVHGDSGRSPGVEYQTKLPASPRRISRVWPAELVHYAQEQRGRPTARAGGGRSRGQRQGLRAGSGYRRTRR